MTHQPRVLSAQVLPRAYCRFRLEEFQSRFGDIEWFLHDAETLDPETGLIAVVMQGSRSQCMEYYRRALAAEETE